jgi:hypothetical protein
MTSLTDIFPLAGGKTGVEVLIRTVPLKFRFYSGPLRILVKSCKANCRLVGNTALVGTKPVQFKTTKSGYVTKITIAFNYPFIERIEADMKTAPFEITPGTLHLIPDSDIGALLSFTAVAE